MNFLDAIELVKPGGGVRRKCWEIYILITVSEYDLSMNFNDYNLDLNDFLSHDWEVIE